MRFGLRGPSHVISTGCTSSTDAIAYSVRQIQSGRLDSVLTGGADAPIALGIVKGFVLMADAQYNLDESGNPAGGIPGVMGNALMTA